MYKFEKKESAHKDDTRGGMALQKKKTNQPQNFGGVVQAQEIGGKEVDISNGYTSWQQDDTKWHINWRLGEKDVYHVTNESVNPKVHYFFTLDAGLINDATAPKGMKGRKGTSKKFSALPDNVKSFIEANIQELQG